MHRDEALGRPGDLKRCILRSRRRTGWWETSARLFLRALVHGGAQAQLREGSAVGTELVGRDLGRSEALLLEQLAHELSGRRLVPAALDEDSSTSPSSSTARHRYICCPRCGPTISSRCQRKLGLRRRRRRFARWRAIASELQDPAPDRLVGDSDARSTRSSSTSR